MDPVVVTGSIEYYINAIDDLVTATVTWIGQFATKIASTPILVLSCVAVPLVGIGIRGLKRLMSSKA